MNSANNFAFGFFIVLQSQFDRGPESQLVFGSLPSQLRKGSMSATSPFGLILPSRPVLTNPIVISETQYAFTFASLPTFSHLVVFLLPGITLSEGTLAGVYIQLPGLVPEFKLLGALGTEKQSAIFRISGTSPASYGSHSGLESVEEEMTDVDASPKAINGATSTATTAGETTVGISIEQATMIISQLESQQGSNSVPSTALVSARYQRQQPTPLSTKALAQRIIRNAFNFLASFAGTSTAGGQEVVPLKSFQDWWTKFERRVENDPGFLEREDDT